MLKEKIDTIIEAEDKAASAISEANSEAKKIILDGEEKAEKIIAGSIMFAKQNYKAKIDEGAKSAEEAAKKVMEDGISAAAKLKKDAEKNIDKAVAEILKKVLTEWQ